MDKAQSLHGCHIAILKILRPRDSTHQVSATNFSQGFWSYNSISEAILHCSWKMQSYDWDSIHEQCVVSHITRGNMVWFSIVWATVFPMHSFIYSCTRLRVFQNSNAQFIPINLIWNKISNQSSNRIFLSLVKKILAPVLSILLCRFSLISNLLYSDHKKFERYIFSEHIKIN